MLKTVQGGKWSFGRDVILQIVQGVMGVLGSYVMLQNV